MRKKLLLAGIAVSCFSLASCGNSAPQDNDPNIEPIKKVGNIEIGNIRVQILDERTFRFEQKYNNQFVDENTFFIPNRDAYEGAIFTERDEGRNHIIDLGDLEIYVPNTGALDGIYITYKESVIYKYSEAINTGELPTPRATPNAYAIADAPRILIPEGGYTYRENTDNLSGYEIQEDAIDTYVLVPLMDPATLREQYVNLTGRSEMVRLATLGTWDSKYYAYTEKSAYEEMDQYIKYDLPLDCMVIDTDWRRSLGADGIGYDVNTDLFPDMERFLNNAHDRNVEIMFNDHPEPVRGTTSVLDPKDVKYREENLKKYLKMGLDYWWYDRNWTVSLKSPTSMINHETWGMYLFNDITKHAHQEIAGDNDIYKRPIIMANADNIANGDYKGIKNTASHRYSMTWTGDIYSPSWGLEQEVANIIKGGANGVAYLNSDLGGHQGNPSDELYARWIQYGALSPIFRPHSSKFNQRFRQPWLYGDEVLGISRDYMKMRYRLMALLYQLSNENYETGMPLMRSLEFNYKNDKNASRLDEYLVGDNILFAPVTTDVYNAFPANWIDGTVSVKYFNNKNLSGEPVKVTSSNNIDFQWGNGSPAIGINADNFSGVFEATIKPTQDIALALTCDDGVKVYVDDKLVLDKWQPNDSVTFDACKLKANESHKLKIEYYEEAGGAFLNLKYKNETGKYNKNVYFPEGQWVDVFTGDVYEGKKSYDFTYDLATSPIFVRLGSVTPLLDYANNTTKLDWGKVTYDVYPSKTASDASYLYEDDHNTTAYKLGQSRKSNYKAYFNEEENCFVIELDKAIGSYNGSEDLTEREVNVRIHQVGDFKNVSRVTLNGKLQGADFLMKGESFPFSTEGGALDSDVLNLNFKTNVLADNIVKIYLD